MKLSWDTIGERFYETGVKKGVLFPLGSDGTYPSGVAWNGLTKVSESPSGAEATPYYANNIQYLNLVSVEKFGATIEAYTYPDEFAECDGSYEIADGVYVGQQTRKTFGLCYTTAIGNDIDGVDHGHKLHIVYGATVTPSQKEYTTINADPEAVSLSWELSTTPLDVDMVMNGKHITSLASMTIESTKSDSTNLKTLEDILYGTDDEDPRLPLPSEIQSIMSATSVG